MPGSLANSINQDSITPAGQFGRSFWMSATAIIEMSSDRRLSRHQGGRLPAGADRLLDALDEIPYRVRRLLHERLGEDLQFLSVLVRSDGPNRAGGGLRRIANPYLPPGSVF